MTEQNMNIPDLNALSPAALAALATIGALGDSDRMAVLKLHGVALGPRLWRPQDGGTLPTLTALVPERDRDSIYASSVWGRYEPTSWVVAYMLQAPGLARLSARLGGIGLAKAGTAGIDAVERRVADLGAERYGAWHREERRYPHSAGFDTFSPPPRLQLAAQHRRSPVALHTYGIAVGLPRGLSPSRFESEFNARLFALRLQNVAGTATGRALCARTGIDPAELTRFYLRGGRYRAATELTLLRPQADCGALSRVCADVVIDHVLGLLPRRSGR